LKLALVYKVDKKGIYEINHKNRKEDVLMKCYKIPVTWECWGMMEIEAESLKEAEYKARFKEPLPDENYIDDSLVLDKDNPHYGESKLKNPFLMKTI